MLTKGQRKRLSYVVPGYVWQQGHFDFDITPVRQLLDTVRGVIYIDSPSMSRREYAATCLLAYLQQRDYHVDIGWTSFHPREPHEFTGALRLPSVSPVHVIAVKTEVQDVHVDQIEDIVVGASLAIVTGDRLQLRLAHTVLHLKANTASSLVI